MQSISTVTARIHTTTNIIFSIIFILLVFNKNSNASGADVIIFSKKTVASKMKDPGSVKFKDVFSSSTEKGGVVACGRVNSKNSFGAYTGFTRFISNGQTTFIEGVDKSNPPFPELWTMLCLNREY